MSQPPPPAQPHALRLTVSPEREGDLRARLCARDERALVELIELTTPWLLGLVQGMLKDQDESEDVLLETFRTIWDRIEPTGPTGLLPLVFRIARNRAIDRLRARKRRSVLLSRFHGELSASGADHIPGEVRQAQPGWQVHAKVQQALRDLPEEQGAVIQLAYYQGLTQSEMAEVLNLPLGTVKTRLRLAYAKLRNSLASLQEWIT